jgi:hypothetical protein|tara:strand:- start:166 stop:417 length:252 start_codon:yes stop_codon:yes gene_type:complete
MLGEEGSCEAIVDAVVESMPEFPEPKNTIDFFGEGMGEGMGEGTPHWRQLLEWILLLPIPRYFFLSLGPFLPYVRAHSSHISP